MSLCLFAPFWPSEMSATNPDSVTCHASAHTTTIVSATASATTTTTATATHRRAGQGERQGAVIEGGGDTGGQRGREPDRGQSGVCDGEGHTVACTAERRASRRGVWFSGLLIVARSADGPLHQGPCSAHVSRCHCSFSLSSPTICVEILWLSHATAEHTHHRENRWRTGSWPFIHHAVSDTSSS